MMIERIGIVLSSSQCNLCGLWQGLNGMTGCGYLVSVAVKNDRRGF